MTEISLLFEILQGATLICAIATLCFTIKRQKYQKKYELNFDIPVFLWMIHAIIYYVFVFLVRYPYHQYDSSFSFTSWSTVLRFHGFATYLIIEITKYAKEKIKYGTDRYK
jgi:Ca2+/Na+ antiporter